MLIGVDDGLDQKQPALVADHWGNVYLAFVEDAPGRIMLCWLEAGASDWTSPQPLTGPDVPAMYPALGVVAERLVVAFRSRRGSVILDLPLLDPVMNTTIFNDGPDPVESSDPVVPRRTTER